MKDIQLGKTILLHNFLCLWKQRNNQVIPIHVFSMVWLKYKTRLPKAVLA